MSNSMSNGNQQQQHGSVTALGKLTSRMKQILTAR